MQKFSLNLDKTTPSLITFKENAEAQSPLREQLVWLECLSTFMSCRVWLNKSEINELKWIKCHMIDEKMTFKRDLVAARELSAQKRNRIDDLKA